MNTKNIYNFIVTVSLVTVVVVLIFPLMNQEQVIEEKQVNMRISHIDPNYIDSWVLTIYEDHSLTLTVNGKGEEKKITGEINEKYLELIDARGKDFKFKDYNMLLMTPGRTTIEIVSEPKYISRLPCITSDLVCNCEGFYIASYEGSDYILTREHLFINNILKLCQKKNLWKSIKTD